MTRLLYPTSRKFPFDDACGDVVRGLEARNWDVPGITVEFREYGSGEQRLRYVESVSSGRHDVLIRFGRPQGTLPGGRWNDVAAAAAIRIPGRELRVYDDESGPSLSVYVGDDWERDRDAGWTAPNARLYARPRRCVEYSGEPRPRGVRAARLVHREDYREYPHAPGEPESFVVADVFEEFRARVVEVSSYVSGFPTVEGVEAPRPALPQAVPDGRGPLYTYATARDEQRIAAARKDRQRLAPPDRYGLSGGGYRLAHLGIRRGPDLPEVAFDGFCWCADTPEVAARYKQSFADVLVRVTLRDARGVYVADHAVYERRRRELADAIGHRDHFTGEEVDDFFRARACTIVPLVEYRGDYDDPVYLVNRELDFDEVDVVEQVLGARDGAVSR